MNKNYGYNKNYGNYGNKRGPNKPRNDTVVKTK